MGKAATATGNTTGTAIAGWLCAAILAGCQVTPPPPPGPVPLAQVLAAVERENKAFEDLHATGPASAQALGALNGKLQSIGYFRRVPAQPTTELLQSALRRLAAQKGLAIKSIDVQMPAERPVPPSQKLAPGQRWEPQLDDLRGVLQLRVDLVGAPKDIAAYIDSLPEQVDRLVVVTEREAFSNGAILKLEAYFERQLPAPEVQLAWPTLAERLRAAGYADGDPAVLAAPEYAKLKAQVELGQKRLPDVRRLVQISADFPRWLLRWQFFEERGRAETAVHGSQVMDLK
ncbi:MAG: hypothetical protein HY902_08385 [Deltaproteobacteria bacterium]|nr:hypothetical protein [Deltaproteobacteria bacterium]